MRSNRMRINTVRRVCGVGVTSSLVLLALTAMHGQQKLPVAPYEEAKGWGPEAPGKFEWEPGGVEVDRQGRVYVLRRSDPSVWVLDPSGKVLRSFGEGLVVWAHGLHVDRGGNIWVTDCALGPPERFQDQMLKPNASTRAAGRGHQVYKFSPEGKLLMTLGKAGQPGMSTDQFNCPTDVVTAADGSIFIGDGHNRPESPNARILKFAQDGRFIKEWGRKGAGPGEFGTPHTLAMDSQGRVFVSDHVNHRIQVFDQEGRYLDEYTQFGAPNAIAVSANDVLAVSDGDTGTLIIGDARTGKATGMIPDVVSEPVAVDGNGNIYVGEVFRHDWRKFIPKR